MIRLLNNNDLVDVVTMVKKTYFHDYYHGYGRNEVAWTDAFIKIIRGQMSNDPNFFAVGSFDESGTLQGFLTARTFHTYYTDEAIMDVKDCIIDPDNEGRNLYIVKRLFDSMIAHVKKHGGKHWRADSIHTEERAFNFAKFLKKFYGAAIHTSSRGVIE